MCKRYNRNGWQTLQKFDNKGDCIICNRIADPAEADQDTEPTLENKTTGSKLKKKPDPDLHTIFEKQPKSGSERIKST